jgi:predicted aspartyl protease
MGTNGLPLREKVKDATEMLSCGLAMRKGVALAVATLLLFVPVRLPAESSSTLLPIDVTQAHGGNIIVVGSINGSRPLHLLFDTGAPEVVTPQAAKEIGLVSKSGTTMSIVGAGESKTAVQRASVDTLALGEQTLHNLTFLVAPLPPAITSMTARYPIDGIIGYGVLERLVVTIDYVGHTLQLADPVTFRYIGAGSMIPLQETGLPPTITASLNGIPGEYQLDSGNAGATVVFRNFARAHQLPSDPLHTVRIAAGGVIGGAIIMDFGRESSLTIGPYTLQQPIVSFASTGAGAFASKTQAGNIGANILARFTVTLDYSRHALYLEPNANFGRRFMVKGTGLSYDKSESGAVSVLLVITGSPADEAGLAPGDEIVAVQGRSTAGLGVADLQAMESTQEPLRVTFLHQGVRVTRTLIERDLIP